MRIIEGHRVDLINPFPTNEIPRIFEWMRCYHNITESDESPKDEESFVKYLVGSLPACESYGLIDRNDTFKSGHEAPLVGAIIFEPSTRWNTYMHIATPRRAWGAGFIDEGIYLALDDIFTKYPSILRVSAYALRSNSPVYGLSKRLGFAHEGTIPDAITQRGEPKTLNHYGMTRRAWNAINDEKQGEQQGATGAVA